MPIAPDTKDWTWVVERPCAECGVDVQQLDLGRLPEHIRTVASAWLPVLERPDVAVRPDDRTWSPLEYACHVRDVLRLYDERLELMLTEDGPRYANWDQDATAVEDRYGGQDPLLVGEQLVEAGDAVAARFAGVTDDQWSRTGFRSDGAAFTVESFARYFLHDPLHHLHDVGAPLPAID